MCTFSRMRRFKTFLYPIKNKTKESNNKYFGAWLIKGEVTDIGRRCCLSFYRSQRRISPGKRLVFSLQTDRGASKLISNRTAGRYHVTHGLLCTSFSLFRPLRARIEIRVTLRISGRGRAARTKERRCTPAEIKAAAARLTPHPPTLALGRWRWVICSLGFSQHTTSPTQHWLLQMLSFSHTGAQDSLGPVL